MKLPGYLKKYFWDVDFKTLDTSAHSKDILGRILEYGDEKAVKWMNKNFSREEIADLLYHYRLVSPKSANFWALIFGIAKRNILCLKKPYLEIQRGRWLY